MATIRDVARAAGVSTATVSHVLNDTRYVSDEVRARVLKAIAELNYRPSRVAASLRSRRSQSILLVIPDITNPFFPLLVRGVQDTFDRRKYAVIVGNTDRRRDRELEFLNLALRTFADGLIINPSEITYEDLLPLIEQGIHVVLIGTRISHPDLDVVSVDNRAGAADAVRYLIELGHDHIAMVSGPMSTSSGRQRYEGYQRAMEEAGLPIEPGWVVEESFDEAGGYKGTQQLLTHPKRPTAIFAAADLMALGVLRAARAAGLSLPGDISVVGFDGIPATFMTTPTLTTIDQPKYEMGECAAQLLMARIHENDQPDCQRTVMEHHLVVGGSTAPPPDLS